MAFRLLILLFGSLPAPLSTTSVDFEKEVAPFFADNCLKCHGATKQPPFASLRSGPKAASRPSRYKQIPSS